MGKALQFEQRRGKLLIVKDGYLVCPRCRKNKRLLKIRPGDEAKRITVFCRDCKSEIPVEISKGECFESRGQ